MKYMTRDKTISHRHKVAITETTKIEETGHTHQTIEDIVSIKVVLDLHQEADHVIFHDHQEGSTIKIAAGIIGTDQNISEAGQDTKGQTADTEALAGQGQAVTTIEATTEVHQDQDTQTSREDISLKQKIATEVILIQEKQILEEDTPLSLKTEKEVLVARD